MTELDRKTRGRTAPERLGALDTYLVHAERDLLAREGDAAFVDVGFGEHPWTTLETARALREVRPGLGVIGVELDPERAAAAAREHADARTHFRQGGFALPLEPGERARLVRAMNVLRTYPLERVAQAHRLLGAPLVEGGLLVEGSTDTPGEVLVAHLLRRTGAGLEREALLFHTTFARGFAPLLFRDWLPRDLRRRVRPGEPIHAFFSDWAAAWDEARAGGVRDPAEVFRATVVRLAARREGVSTEPWLLERGYLVWRPPGGVPA